MVMHKSVSIYSGGRPHPMPEERMGNGFGGVSLEAWGTEEQDLEKAYRGEMFFEVSPDGLLTIRYGRGYALEGEVYGAPIQLPMPLTVERQMAIEKSIKEGQ